MFGYAESSFMNHQSKFPLRVSVAASVYWSTSVSLKLVGAFLMQTTATQGLQRLSHQTMETCVLTQSWLCIPIRNKHTNKRMYVVFPRSMHNFHCCVLLVNCTHTLQGWVKFLIPCKVISPAIIGWSYGRPTASDATLKPQVNLSHGL